MFAFIKDEKQRYALLIGFALVVVGAFVYSYVIDKSSLEIAQLVYSYEHGQVLVCEGIEVTSKNFNYDYATQSLIGLDEHKGKVLSISDCTIK